jgi:hypothetical protein
MLFAFRFSSLASRMKLGIICQQPEASSKSLTADVKKYA